MQFNKEKALSVGKYSLLLFSVLYVVPFILSLIFKFFLRMELIEIYLAVEVTWHICFFIMVLAFDDTGVETK